MKYKYKELVSRNQSIISYIYRMKNTNSFEISINTVEPSKKQQQFVSPLESHLFIEHGRLGRWGARASNVYARGACEE